MLLALLFTHAVRAADPTPVPLNCSKDLIAQASQTFQDHACHLAMQEPGGFAVFYHQRVDGVLTDTEIPILIGLGTYRFKEVPDENRPQVCGVHGAGVHAHLQPRLHRDRQDPGGVSGPERRTPRRPLSVSRFFLSVGGL